jgi:hypothetical protein
MGMYLLSQLIILDYMDLKQILSLHQDGLSNRMIAKVLDKMNILRIKLE